ncbi:polyhydroxyalkanoate synthesis regulator DNA-binding domain-containing protein [Mycobacterium sp.]|uniref:polyhydroxyalkanoate synthesis regulator DNA-binding domain-containing protein n=1 Tax=Mycobacterium sp. TaxID=1785 RepID=UPI003F9C9264
MSYPTFASSEDPGPREIRRYSNRKLYDTAERRFTSVSAIEDLVHNDIDFVVVDHRTGVDLTEDTLRRVLSARPREVASSTGLLLELIRFPARIANALLDGDRDIAELRELRQQQVNSLSVILESLLDEESNADSQSGDTASGG